MTSTYECQCGSQSDRDHQDSQPAASQAKPTRLAGTQVVSLGIARCIAEEETAVLLGPVVTVVDVGGAITEVDITAVGVVSTV